MSGAPNGGWTGIALAATEVEGGAGVDHGAGGDAGSTGAPSGAP